MAVIWQLTRLRWIELNPYPKMNYLGVKSAGGYW
jgi:hypothetical protein